mmetsp:Transcript_133672/g.250092  ORF Transcript_133672/g.250092 Transcript_133672/m.250092 type:complete len:497 (-) Transcript_133672:58-1548(-)
MKMGRVCQGEPRQEKVASVSPARSCFVRSRGFCGRFPAAAVTAAVFSACLLPVPATALSVGRAAPPIALATSATVSEPQLRGFTSPVNPRELKHAVPDVPEATSGTRRGTLQYSLPSSGASSEKTSTSPARETGALPASENRTAPGNSSVASETQAATQAATQGFLRVTPKSPRDLRHLVPDVPPETPGQEGAEEGATSAPEELASPAPGPAPGLASSPGPAAPAIQKGVTIMLTANNSFLVLAFQHWGLCRYVPLMTSMLGKPFVVVDTHGDGSIGLPSPDGSQNGIWWFPPVAISLWKATVNGPVVTTASGGLATAGAETVVGPQDDPWSVDGALGEVGDVLDPKLDASSSEATGIMKPPYRRANSRKVRQVISVKCMEKMHEDPSYMCPPEELIGPPSPAPVNETSPPRNASKTEEMEKQISGLKAQVDELKDADKGSFDKAFEMKAETKPNDAVNSVNNDTSFKHPSAEKQSRNSMTNVVPRERTLNSIPFR